jgi:hypothetical protein
MLDKIRNLALEKLGSEEAVNAFMEGFEKEAQGNLFGGPSMAAKFFANSEVQKVGLGLGASLLGAILVKGVSTGAKAVEGHGLRAKFEMSLAQVMSSNKVVKGARPERAREYAETMFKFAPHVASDPNLLGAILSNAVLGESIDPQTIKTLVELEGRYTDNHQTNQWATLKH